MNWRLIQAQVCLQISLSILLAYPENVGQGSPLLINLCSSIDGYPMALVLIMEW